MNEELKNKLKECKTQEEAEKLLEEDKSDLTDEELNQISGGLCRIGNLKTKIKAVSDCQ